MKLRLDQISKAFNGHQVLKEVSLLLEKVHTLVLIGPSGGGKTTLLRIIAGLEYPTGGTLAINDQPVVFEEVSLLKHRRTIGTVFQAFNLFPHLTALQNITLPLEKVHGHPPAQAAEIAALNQSQSTGTLPVGTLVKVPQKNWPALVIFAALAALLAIVGAGWIMQSPVRGNPSPGR